MASARQGLYRVAALPTTSFLSGFLQGYGIPKEDLPHIFDKFYRSKDPSIADQTGSGLGLAMSAVIIHLHGGEIEVESEPGEGSHFIIRLPKEEYYLGKQ